MRLGQGMLAQTAQAAGRQQRRLTILRPALEATLGISQSGAVLVVLIGPLGACEGGAGAVAGSRVKRSAGEREAAAETSAARRANSRREIAEPFFDPIEGPPGL